MSPTILVLVFALSTLAAFLFGVTVIPEQDGDLTFDWIQARYVVQDAQESEAEMERRTR